jgi:hypothetical protein
MPDAVGRIPSPQFRTGLHGAMPLEKRFIAAKEWALRNTPPGDEEYSAIHRLMVSEQNIDNLYGIAERAKARHTPVINPALQAAWGEISRLSHQHNEKARELLEAWKRWRFQVGTDWRHKLLRSPDTLPELAIIDTNQDASVEFPTVIDARQRAKEVAAQIQQLEAVAATYFNAMSFNGLEESTQAVHLCHALYDDNIELKNRIAALEQQVNKLSRKTSPKRKEV